MRAHAQRLTNLFVQTASRHDSIPGSARPQSCRPLTLATRAQQLAGDAAARFCLSGHGAAQPPISRMKFNSANGVSQHGSRDPRDRVRTRR